MLLVCDVGRGGVELGGAGEVLQEVIVEREVEPASRRSIQYHVTL